MHEMYTSLIKTSSILDLLREFNNEAKNVLSHLEQLQHECCKEQSAKI